MALIDEDEFLNQTISVLPENREEEVAKLEKGEETGFVDAFHAFFKTENPIFNIAKELGRPDVGEVDPSFDPFTEENLAGYEDRPDLFVNVANSQDMALIKFQADYEDEQKEILSRASGWTQLSAGLANGVIDPTILIPAVTGIRAIKTGGRILQGSMQGMALGAASGTAREAILQQTQVTRTSEESLENLLAESAIGGILGGAVGFMSNPARNAAKQILGKAMKGEEFSIKIDEKTGSVEVIRDRSAGAAEVDPRVALDNEGIAYLNIQLAKMISGPKAIQSPILRGLDSPFLAVKQFTNEMYIHNFILNKETKGVAREDVAEALIRADEAKMTIIHKEVNKGYAEAVGASSRFTAGLVPERVRKSRGELGYTEYQSRISRGLNDETYIDSLPQVNHAVKLYRTELDRLGDQLVELGILPKDLSPELRRSYLTRIYNTKKLLTVEGRAGFLTTVTRWVRKHNKDGSVRKNPLDEFEAEGIADDIYDNIIGEGDKAFAANQFAADMVSKGKFTKSRSLLMPTKDLEEWLVTDAQQLTSVYSKKASAAIHMTKSLNKMGHKDLNSLILSMKLQKDRDLLRISDPKERVKLQDRFITDSKLVQDGYKAMMGQLGTPGTADRFFETLRAFQYVRLLGGVTVSSFSEISMAPFVLGLGNTLQHGYFPMLRNYKASKLAKDQYRDMGIGLEGEMSNVLRHLSDTTVELNRVQTSWDRYMNAIMSGFGKANFIEYFTAFGRRMAAHVSSADIIRSLTKFQKTGKISNKEITRLANMGISRDKYDRILSQFKHVDLVDGSYISNPHLWEDQGAAKIFKGAVQRVTESIIIKPSKGDIPFIFQQNQLGRVIFQFKSFASAATGKITLSSLQRRDARTLNGLMMLTAMGSLSGITKDLIAGREISDDPLHHIGEGVIRSGIPGLLGGVALDFTKNLMDPKTRPYAASNAVGTVLGPTASTIQSTADLAARYTDGNVSKNDVKATLRMLPFTNLFYIQAATNQLLK